MRACIKRCTLLHHSRTPQFTSCYDPVHKYLAWVVYINESGNVYTSFVGNYEISTQRNASGGFALLLHLDAFSCSALLARQIPSPSCWIVFISSNVSSASVRTAQTDCFYPNFNRTWLFSTEFNKSLQYKISQKSVQQEQSCFMRADGQIWRR
jgi:hypothetical protein